MTLRYECIDCDRECTTCLDGDGELVVTCPEHGPLLRLVFPPAKPDALRLAA